jgi:hypothetical protein
MAQDSTIFIPLDAAWHHLRLTPIILLTSIIIWMRLLPGKWKHPVGGRSPLYTGRSSLVLLLESAPSGDLHPNVPRSAPLDGGRLIN